MRWKREKASVRQEALEVKRGRLGGIGREMKKGSKRKVDRGERKRYRVRDGDR